MARRLTEKIKKDIDARVKHLSNEYLLEQTIDAAAGDDYDGCFTPIGAYESAALQQELRRRLDGWLRRNEPEQGADDGDQG